MPTAPPRSRSLLLYMAGDNDLSDSGLRDIRELCQEGASLDTYVACEIDTKGEFDGSIRYEITPPDFEGSAHRMVMERLDERDSGKPETLRQFLRWALRRYPAAETVLVIGGHGTGFRRRMRSVALDDFGSTLDMPEIEHVLKQSGIGPERRLAIMGFDACLMCMLEIAHHFRDYAHLLVGSQQVEPGDGWPYDRVLQLLKNLEMPIEGVAEGIAKVYADSYRQEALTNLTQSAIMLEATGVAMQRMASLGALLSRKIADPGVRRALHDCRRETQTFEFADYVDAVHLARNLQLVGVPEIAREAAALEQALDGCILWSETEGPEVRHAHGLSIWFPAATFAFISHRSKYMGLRGVADARLQPGGWLRFLDAFHAS